MSFSKRESAQEFAELVDDPTRDNGGELAELAALSRALGSPEIIDPAAPRPEFVTHSRTALLEVAQTALSAGAGQPSLADQHRALRRKRRRRDLRMATATALASLAAAGTWLVWTSESAMPGDSLYPVKLAVENVQESAQGDPHERGEFVLHNARVRLNEAAYLIQHNERTYLGSTMASFQEQAQEGAQLLVQDFGGQEDADSVTSVRTFTAESMQEISAMSDEANGEASKLLKDAAKVVESIDSIAAQACPTCEGSGVTGLPPELTSGTPATGGDPAEPSQGADPVDPPPVTESPAAEAPAPSAPPKNRPQASTPPSPTTPKEPATKSPKPSGSASKLTSPVPSLPSPTTLPVPLPSKIPLVGDDAGTADPTKGAETPRESHTPEVDDEVMEWFEQLEDKLRDLAR